MIFIVPKDGSSTVVLKLEYISESPEGLIKTHCVSCPPMSDSGIGTENIWD